jgi:adenylate cyclase
MQKAIHARGGHYEKQYGLIPEFKAGAHIGLVVATEVGDVKSEVVFHGDVLNTAARIQGLCNESRSPFLISSALAERLYSTPGVTLQSLGMRSLKGKESELEIFAVQFDRATAGLTKNRPSSEQA